MFADVGLGVFLELWNPNPDRPSRANVNVVSPELALMTCSHGFDLDTSGAGTNGDRGVKDNRCGDVVSGGVYFGFPSAQQQRRDDF